MKFYKIKVLLRNNLLSKLLLDSCYIFNSFDWKIIVNFLISKISSNFFSAIFWENYFMLISLCTLIYRFLNKNFPNVESIDLKFKELARSRLNISILSTPLFIDYNKSNELLKSKINQKNLWMSTKPFCIEYAKSGRATCNKCKSIIGID